MFFNANPPSNPLLPKAKLNCKHPLLGASSTKSSSKRVTDKAEKPRVQKQHLSKGFFPADPAFHTTTSFDTSSYEKALRKKAVAVIGRKKGGRRTLG